MTERADYTTAGTSDAQILDDLADVLARLGDPGASDIWAKLNALGVIKSIQSGVTANPANANPVDVAITEVDLTKAFAIVAGIKDYFLLSSPDNAPHQGTAQLTTATNLQISFGVSSASQARSMSWQVVEYV